MATNVFISYSWEDDKHKDWVRSLADDLLHSGIEVTLDQYDLIPGDRIPFFMEQAVSTADKVIIVCTPIYKQKADSREGGVGYEGNIITDELYKGIARKFIPIVRKGPIDNVLPKYLASTCYLDFTDDQKYEQNLSILLSALRGESRKPPVNKQIPNKQDHIATKHPVTEKMGSVNITFISK